jgi:hypothetical protein
MLIALIYHRVASTPRREPATNQPLPHGHPRQCTADMPATRKDLTMDAATAPISRHLIRSRQKVIVGRGPELETLRSAAGEPGSPAVVYIHGPGGIGKSTLLHRFADECQISGRTVVTLDGRLLDPSPVSFETEAAVVLSDPRSVLLVDAFEQCQGLENWLRTQFLPRLPSGVLVVLAGRRPPAVDWVTDPGWAGVFRVITLTELPRPDAVALLHAWGVDEQAYESVLAFTGGYPLALALAAAGMAGTPGNRRWAPTPDVVTTLMRQVLDGVPSPEHLMSLRIAAHALVVTESLLREVMELPEAERLFGWLCEQPFVQLAPRGVLLHGLVKEVVDADFRWRDPDRYAAVHARLGSYLLHQAQTASDAEVMPVMRGLTYLKRYGAAAAYYATVDRDGDLYESAVTPADHPVIRQMTEQCEGAEALPILDYWLGRRPDAFRAYRRSGTGELLAYMMWLRVGPVAPQERAADPVLAAVCEHIGNTSSLRPGEQVLVARFLVDPRDYHQQSTIMQLMQLRMCVDWIRTPRLAWSFVLFKNEELWQPLMTHLGHHRVPGVPLTTGPPYAVFAFDWRLSDLDDWFTHTAPGAVGAPEGPPALIGTTNTVLSLEQFTAAVRDALRDWHRTDESSANPLLTTRLVLSRTDAVSDPAVALRLLLRKAVDLLAEQPKQRILRDVLSTTYFSGVTTQAAAAARLHLPWSTYRRHLRRGVEMVVQRMWQWEVGAGSEAPTI